MENVSKSIIYGNTYENRYAKFLPVCSSISDRASIQSILDYLRDTPHFKKYNRTAYAYRVEEVPVVFITEKKNIESQHFQGSFCDETIEGSGQKLLHLLQKFNIRNVFIGIMIQQFNPLFPFQTTNYRAIVENCRLLLDQLYKKVIALQDNAELKSVNDLLLHSNQNTKLKKCNISDAIQIPQPLQKKVIKERPNHIYSGGKPQFLAQPQKNSEHSIIYEIKFLWERCKMMKEQFENIINSLEDKQIQQLKYYAMYDKNVIINQVFKLFTLLLGTDRNYLMNQYNFQQLKQIKFEIIEQKTLKKLDDTLKSNKKLSIDSIMKNNRPIGIIFAIIQLKIRFSKTLKRISQLMQKSNFNEKQLQEVQKIHQHQNSLILDKNSTILPLSNKATSQKWLSSSNKNAIKFTKA